jgi:DNA-binding response OmpR family regulator
MERALARRGYTVLTSAHPGEALLITERHADSLDLVISDVGLPFLSGPELVSRLRGSMPGLKVLFVSGYPDRPSETVGMPYLQKPFTEAVLAAEVRKVLDETA